MPERSVASSNANMPCCPGNDQNGCAEEVIRLRTRHAECGNLAMARKIFDELGTYKNLATWNAMISAYARVGVLASARGLFDKMEEMQGPIVRIWLWLLHFLLLSHTRS
ncbi:hypothetical protein BC332_22028 [Capsicum chinense]|nr:hypothetical protein BC332_22028 [Capsicum chinense]